MCHQGRRELFLRAAVRTVGRTTTKTRKARAVDGSADNRSRAQMLPKHDGGTAAVNQSSFENTIVNEHKTETRITDDGTLARIHVVQHTHYSAGILERRIVDETGGGGTTIMIRLYSRGRRHGRDDNVNMSNRGNRVKLAADEESVTTSRVRNRTPMGP